MRTLKPRIAQYLAALSGGTILFAALFRSLLGAHSLAVLVPADLAGAAVAIAMVYPFMRRSAAAGPIGTPISPRTVFLVTLAGLVVIVTITILSREWWLAIEALVFVSLVAGAFAYRQMGVARQGVGQGDSG